MLQRINKTSSAPQHNTTDNEVYLHYLFNYIDESVKDKIFSVKKSLPEGISWAVDNLFTIITNNISKDAKKTRIGIIPIPSRGYYRREKSNDHMLAVSKEIKRCATNSSLYNINVDVLDCLIPLTLTQQKKLSKEVRESRKESMFIIDPIIKQLINRKTYTHIWIIDDVTTTGSTLIGATETVSKHINHQKIFTIGLAH